MKIFLNVLCTVITCWIWRLINRICLFSHGSNLECVASQKRDANLKIRQQRWNCFEIITKGWLVFAHHDFYMVRFHEWLVISPWNESNVPKISVHWLVNRKHKLKHSSKLYLNCCAIAVYKNVYKIRKQSFCIGTFELQQTYCHQLWVNYVWGYRRIALHFEMTNV